jgi:hypothetical protein
MDPDLDRYPVVWAAAGLDRAVFPVSPAALRVLADALVAPISAAISDSIPGPPGARPTVAG